MTLPTQTQQDIQRLAEKWKEHTLNEHTEVRPEGFTIKAGIILALTELATPLTEKVEQLEKENERLSGIVRQANSDWSRLKDFIVGESSTEFCRLSDAGKTNKGVVIFQAYLGNLWQQLSTLVSQNKVLREALEGAATNAKMLKDIAPNLYQESAVAIEVFEQAISSTTQPQQPYLKNNILVHHSDEPIPSLSSSGESQQPTGGDK